MADKAGYARLLDPDSAPIPLRLADNGDGTHSLAIVAASHIETIDHSHDKVHAGLMWHLSYRVASVAQNGNIDIAVTTGAQRMHVVIGSYMGGDGWSLLYEAPTLSVPGTALTVFNMRRGTAGAPLATARHTPTVTAVGLELDGVFVPGGTGASSNGGAVRRDIEWIFAPNTIYLLRHTNLASNAQPASISVGFYEEA